MSTSVDTGLNQIYVPFPMCTATFRTPCTIHLVVNDDFFFILKKKTTFDTQSVFYDSL
jgi:hypothetical protein